MIYYFFDTFFRLLLFITIVEIYLILGNVLFTFPRETSVDFFVVCSKNTYKALEAGSK